MELTKKTKILIGSGLALVAGLILLNKKVATDKANTANNTPTPNTLNTPTPSGVVKVEPFVLTVGTYIQVKAGISELFCYNDKELKQIHYRTIPRNGEDNWQLLSALRNPANDDSEKFRSFDLGDGNYAIAISMYEDIHIPEGNPEVSDMVNLINSTSGKLVGKGWFGGGNNDASYAIKGTAKSSTTFTGVEYRKIVWVNSKHLVLNNV